MGQTRTMEKDPPHSHDVLLPLAQLEQPLTVIFCHLTITFGQQRKIGLTSIPNVWQRKKGRKRPPPPPRSSVAESSLLESQGLDGCETPGTFAVGEDSLHECDASLERARSMIQSLHASGFDPPTNLRVKCFQKLNGQISFVAR